MTKSNPPEPASAPQTAATTAPPPRGLKASGKALWRDVLKDFELGEHERVILREAAKTADLIDALQATVERDGVMGETSQGVRVHPAVVELRQQRIAFARLVAALRIPADIEGRTAEQVGVRGVYGLAVSS